MEVELPPLEDIYDFNEDMLNFHQAQIKSALDSFPEGSNEKFERKARRLLETIEIELYERVSINQIALFCAKELDSELFNEVQQEEKTTPAEDPMEKMWGMRKQKNKKTRQEFVKNVLKNTQQSTGVVIGASTIPNRPPVRPAFKPEVKPPPRKPPVSKRPEIRHKSDQIKHKGTEINTQYKKTTDGKSTQEDSSVSEMKTERDSLIENYSEGVEESKENYAGTFNQNSSEKNNCKSSVSTHKQTFEDDVDTEIQDDFKADSQTKNDKVAFLDQTEFKTVIVAPKSQIKNRDVEEFEDDAHYIKEIEHSSQPKKEIIASENKQGKDSKMLENEIAKDSHGQIQLKDFEKQQSVDSIEREPEQLVQQTVKESIKEEILDKMTQLRSEILEELSDETHLNSIKPEHRLGAADAEKSYRLVNKGITQEESHDSAISKGEVCNEEAKEVLNLKSRATSKDNSDKFDENFKEKSEENLKEKSEENFKEKDKSEEKKPEEDGEYSFQSKNYQMLDNLRKLLKQKKEEGEPIIQPPAKTTSEKPPKAEAPKATKTEQRVRDRSPKPRSPQKPVESKVKKPIKDVTDYTGIYSNFFDIFSGSQILREFNCLQAARDTLTTFKEFLSTISTPDFEFQRKFKLALAPLELNPRDIVTGAHEELMKPAAFSEKEKYYRVIKARSEVYDIVTRAFNKKKGWTELPHGLNLKASWNLMWTWSKPTIDMSKLLVWQKVNHFPETKNFSRKDLLKKNMEKIKKISTKCQAVWNVIPPTYSLPKEYVQFVELFHEQEEKARHDNIWIMKPIGKSRGRGISVVNDINQVTYGEPMVIQKYISNPLLLNNFKFDLRLYVLITSFSPLEAFLYEEGFARMSTMPYSTNPEKLHNKFIHLTNSSIQKHSHSQGMDPVDKLFGGTKISLQSLKEKLTLMNVSWENIWHQIREVVLKSLIAVQSEIPNYPCCFDLVGYDVLIDTDHKVWLIEINSSPSLARDNFLDDLIKQKLIDDTLDLIEPIHFDVPELVRVLDRRLLELQKGQTNNSAAQMNADLTKILGGKVPRRFAQTPESMGKYQQIAPSPLYDKLHKMAYPRLYKT